MKSAISQEKMGWNGAFAMWKLDLGMRVLANNHKCDGCTMVPFSKPKWKFWLKLQTQKLSAG
jgi:hypothetical protein